MVTTARFMIDSSPTIGARMSGLLDHASVSDGVEWLQPLGLGLSFNCMTTDATTDYCGPASEAKDFNAPSVADGAQFAVYGGVACKPFGFDEQTGISEIERVFALNESKGVERAFMEVLARDYTGTEDAWGPATDLTPAGGAVKPSLALAIMEGYAASVYAGQPTIHLPYTLGALLHDRLSESGGKLFTRLGAKAAVGAGYEYPNTGPDGTEPDPGELWAYVSGEVSVARGGVISNVQHDRNTNDIYALAERQYVATADCFIAAIRVRME